MRYEALEPRKLVRRYHTAGSNRRFRDAVDLLAPDRIVCLRQIHDTVAIRAAGLSS